jgi:protein involved in plasmid replication-relaxation
MKPAPAAQAYPLTDRDERIVRAVATYRFLTALDVAHLLFHPGSLTYVREVLRRMAERQLLCRFPLPMPSGARLNIYAIGAKGRSALAEGGYYTPSKLRSLSYGYLWHCLLLTRFCIAAHYWGADNPSFTLAETRLSYELSRTSPRMTLCADGQETPALVIPDAWLLFERSDGNQFPILVEIDRGTEYQERFKAHVQGRLELVRSGTYAKVFGMRAVVVAYVTTAACPDAAATRRATMQRWTDELLDDLDLSNWASLFRFAAVEYNTLYTAPLFDAPEWYRPDEPETALPLLPLPEETGKEQNPW